MSNAKHTPGPWLVHDRSTVHMQDQDIARVGVRLDVVTHLATEIFGLVARCGGSGAPGEADANARLIAAAPDLLAAAQSLINGRTDCNDRNCGECTHCRARAAIAKATGTDDGGVRRG